MSAVRKQVLVFSLYIGAVLLASLAVGCLLLGPRYEISQIPPQQKDRMVDFDWIGVKWIERAGCAFIGSVVCVGAGYWYQRRNRRRVTQNIN